MVHFKRVPGARALGDRNIGADGWARLASRTCAVCSRRMATLARCMPFLFSRHAFSRRAVIACTRTTGSGCSFFPFQLPRLPKIFNSRAKKTLSTFFRSLQPKIALLDACLLILFFLLARLIRLCRSITKPGLGPHPCG